MNAKAWSLLTLALIFNVGTNGDAFVSRAEQYSVFTTECSVLIL